MTIGPPLRFSLAKEGEKGLPLSLTQERPIVNDPDIHGIFHHESALPHTTTSGSHQWTGILHDEVPVKGDHGVNGR